MNAQSGSSAAYSQKTQQFLQQLILQKLGIQYPIFLAPMAGTSTPELAAAVSNAGGLGSLGLATATADGVRQAIQKTRQLTDKPFNCNFFCHQPPQHDPATEQVWIDYMRPHFETLGATPPSTLKPVNYSLVNNPALLEVLLEEKPAVVSFHFGLPEPEAIQQLQQAGIILLATATSLAEVQRIEQAGLDGIVAQGVEAGGHRGIFNRDFDPAIGMLDLLRLLKAHTNLPIIATGGIMDGHAIRQVLEQGACAAQLGTAFVICAESAAEPMYRQRLQDPNYQTTHITASISGRPARGLMSAWHTQIDQPERPALTSYSYTYDLAKQLHAVAAKQGNYDFAAYWAGSNVAQIRALNATELMHTLIVELQATAHPAS